MALCVAGCIGTRPARPSAATVAPPPAWRTSLGPGTPIRVEWWSAFGDPVLTDLVGRALAGNPDLGAAAARVDEARAQARLSRAQRMPLASGGLSTSTGQTVGPLGMHADGYGAQPAAQISYDTDVFGRLRQANLAAQATVLANESTRDAVRLGIASSVASGYITLRSLDLRLVIARQTLASRAEGLRIARRRAETGYTSMLELHQAEAEYRATEQLVRAALLAIGRQENALGVLLGSNPGPIERGIPLDRLTIPTVTNGLPADLLRRRPDLSQAEQTLVAADRTLDSARAAMLPNLSLTGSTGLVL